MKLKELLSAVSFTVENEKYDTNFEIEELCHDSRRTHAASLFVCINGATVDGHDFALSAYDKGCRHFVVERDIPLPSDATAYFVEDSRKALALMAAKFFGNPADELCIIGITGTKGKTTTALMIYNILNACGLKCGYIGSNGIDFGDFHYETANTTPESFDLHQYMREMRFAGVKYLAMEVSSQALYMGRVYGIKFDTCVYTNLSIDHIGGNEHPTFEHYKLCKKSLFSDYGADTVIYNADDKYAEEMISCSAARKIGYSVYSDSDFKASGIDKFKEADKLGVRFDFTSKGAFYKAKISFPGYFSVYNALAATAVCKECGVDLGKIASLLPDIQIKGRFETVAALPFATFIIDYAHNEISLTSVLETLRQYEPKRLICLFGSVGGRTKGRRAELGRAASKLADFSILTADNPDFEAPESVIGDIETQFENPACYVKIPDRKKAIEYAVSMAEEGDIFLFAGKGHENYQLILGEKIPFCEKEILLNACDCLTKSNI